MHTFYLKFSQTISGRVQFREHRKYKIQKKLIKSSTESLISLFMELNILVQQSLTLFYYGLTPYVPVPYYLYYIRMQVLLKEDNLHDQKQSLEETVHGVVEAALSVLSKLNFKRNNCRLELDSPEGQDLFRQYSDLLERLSSLLQAETVPRAYRNNFSKAYKSLFYEKQLCYLPQIYDGAQEGFHYLFVNGEQYCFSDDVIQRGEALVDHFMRLQSYFMFFSEKAKQNNEASYNFQKELLKHAFEQFDYSWVTFEKLYIGELMMIEQAARCIIEDAIQAQRLLAEYEKQQRLRGKIFITGSEYDCLRGNLCIHISLLNSVANIQGKGRDDLQHNILVEAENLLKSVSTAQSKSVRVVATKIKETFEKIRQLLREYSENPDIVDPHLKNNIQLSKQLYEYEQSWEKGNRYFLQPHKKQQLINLSHIIETTQDKYPEFMEMVECSDPQLFLILPSLIILKSLEGEDKELMKCFLTDMDETGSKHNLQYQTIKKNYLQWKSKCSAEGGYLYYNLLQAELIGRKGDLQSLSTSIRALAVQLQRVNPLEWNNLLTAATSQQ